jgi:hypothetical protein
MQLTFFLPACLLIIMAGLTATVHGVFNTTIPQQGFNLAFSDTASPAGAAAQTLTVSSSLRCGRTCLTDPTCLSFTVPRDVDPNAPVTCQLFTQTFAMQYDTTKTTYFANGNALPTQ